MADSLYAAAHDAFDAFHNRETLSTSQISPLGQMIAAAAKTLAISMQENAAEDPELTEHVGPLVTDLYQGVEMAEDAEAFVNWTYALGERITQVEAIRNGPDNEEAIALMPLTPLTALHRTLLRAAILAQHDADWRAWQLPVVLGTSDISLDPWFVYWGWVPDLGSGCPPCPTGCPHLGQMLSIYGRYTNPRGCTTILRKKLDLKYKGIGFSVYVWQQTCTWDVSFEHVQTSACYKSRVSKYLTGWNRCCSSTYLWYTSKKGVRKAFRITTSNTTVPTFPNTQKTDELGKPQNPPPAGANRVRWAR